MKKSRFALLGLMSMALATQISCSKSDKDGDPPPTDIEIVDATSLNDNLEVDGGVKKQGEIPAPTPQGTYPVDFTVNTPNIIITTGNTFDFELVAEDAHPMIVFLKVDGTDDYYEIQVDKNGNLLNKTTLSLPVKTGIKLKAMPMEMKTMEIDATVQVFLDKQSPQNPNLSNLHNWQNWSPPKKIKIKTYGTGVGDIFATLTWNKEGDVDLWLIEPGGNKIYYANPTSPTGGQLDYDNVTGYGPENIFYEGTPPTGTYEVWVHYYSEYEGPTDWVVSLKNGASTQNFRNTLQQDDDSMLVTTFTR